MIISIQATAEIDMASLNVEKRQKNNKGKMMKENNSPIVLQYFSSRRFFLSPVVTLPSRALYGLEPAGPRNDVRSHDCVEGADDSVEYPVT